MPIDRTDLVGRLKTGRRRAGAAVRRAVDRRRTKGDHALVRASGLVDRAWVAAQLGRPLADDDAAVTAYLDGGPDLSPHPLVEPDWADPDRHHLADGRSGLGWCLREGRGRSPHPLLDLARLRAAVPDADAHAHGPLAAWLATADDDTVLPTPSGTPEVRYAEARRAAFAALDAPPPAGPTRVAGRTSIVLAGPGRQRRTVALATEVGALRASGVDVEVVVAGALRPSHRRLLGLLGELYGGVAVVAAPDGPADTVRLGTTRATGERLVVVRPGVTPTAADAVRLAAGLADPSVSVVQPLVLDDRGVVVSAGAVFDAVTRPVALLAGHAAADAAGVCDLPAALAPVVAVRAADLAAAGGFDDGLPGALAETDLSLRLPGRTLLDATVTVVTHGRDLLADPGYPAAAARLEARHPSPPPGSTAAWSAAGFEVVGHRARAAGLGVAEAVVRPVMPAADRLTGVDEQPPRLRWTLDVAAPPGQPGEAWGDTHFARSLAAALGRLGQHVAVDARAARDRASRDLDDVVVVLRGLDRVRPRPGPLHVVWVISHPEQISADELAAYDLGYAASTSWPTGRRVARGAPLRPLLQCTDPTLFHPGLAEPDTGPAVLFVGNARGVHRRAVRWALAAGADLTLYGAGWRGLVPPDRIAGTYVPNTELGALYAAAGVVLNDHWDDMRDDGFLANRLFDAAACGARVLTDEVPGVEAVFGEQVHTFADQAGLTRLLEAPTRSFPDPDRRRALAAAVVREHSFDARAAVLLDDVLVALRDRGRPGDRDPSRDGS